VGVSVVYERECVCLHVRDSARESVWASVSV